MADTKEREPEIMLARDEFTSVRRTLTHHPEAIQTQSRLDVIDDYGNVTTWVLDLFRLEGRVTALVQRGNADGFIRLVVPPLVTAAIMRHHDGLIAKQRKKQARRQAENRRARGEVLGNPVALKLARLAKRKK